MADYRSFRDDVSAKLEVEQGDECCRDNIGAEQALETHSARQHGNNLWVACQFRGEEDDRYENE